MYKIMAIDPGSAKSAYVIYDPAEHKLIHHDIVPNENLVTTLTCIQLNGTRLAIETMQCFGMPVGAEVFDTCIWIGRFYQAWFEAKGEHPDLIVRNHVKMAMCHSHRAKNANVRQAVIDSFPPTGGGKTPQVGTKPKPGPLYGVKTHIWQALGLALTVAKMNKARIT